MSIGRPKVQAPTPAAPEPAPAAEELKLGVTAAGGPATPRGAVGRLKLRANRQAGQ